MADLQVTLNEEERVFLSEFLAKSLKDMRIEEHRTRAPDYRQLIIAKEDVANRLLQKLGGSEI